MPGMASAQKDLLINYDTVMVPVELIYFRGYEKDGMAHLEWATASEINNDHFEIHHSSNGIDFKFNSMIESAGPTYGGGYMAPLKNNRYRLVIPAHEYLMLIQVDIDGTRENLKVLRIGYHPISDNMICYYPHYDLSGREVPESYRGLKIRANR